jgi:hypothetical protein
MGSRKYEVAAQDENISFPCPTSILHVLFYDFGCMHWFLLLYGYRFYTRGVPEGDGRVYMVQYALATKH